MATNAVSICNSALVKIGAERIVALSDNTPAAIACNEQFAKVRDEVLRAHPWNCVISRVELSSVADYEDPMEEWAYKFSLPSDCLRVLRTKDDVDHKIEGRYLLAQDSSCVIQYIKQETDYTKYDAMLLETLSTRLAVDLSYAITQSKVVAEMLMAQYQRLLSEARSVDAQEGTPEDTVITDWIQTRI